MNSCSVEVLPAAAADLGAIVRYLAEGSKASAERFISAFEVESERLSCFPRLGHRRDFGDRLGPIRIWPLRRFPPYLVFYREIEDSLQIIRVLHGKSEIPEILRGDLTSDAS